MIDKVILWILAPKCENPVWHVDSDLEHIPSGFYEECGVKMFYRSTSLGTLKDDGYIFRIDDYNKNKLSLTRQIMH